MPKLNTRLPEGFLAKAKLAILDSLDQLEVRKSEGGNEYIGMPGNGMATLTAEGYTGTLKLTWFGLQPSEAAEAASLERNRKSIGKLNADELEAALTPDQRKALIEKLTQGL